MSKEIRIVKYAFAFILFFMLAGTGCVSVNKNKYHIKSKRSSCSIEQLVGNNTYFYSANYQRKLKKSNRKKQ